MSCGSKFTKIYRVRHIPQHPPDRDLRRKGRDMIIGEKVRRTGRAWAWGRGTLFEII